MKKVLTYIGNIGAISMLFFFGIHIVNNLFPFIPFDSVLYDILDNIVYFVPLIVCAAHTLAATWETGPVFKWILLGLWVIFIVCAFLPVDILGTTAFKE